MYQNSTVLELALNYRSGLTIRECENLLRLVVDLGFKSWLEAKE
jgi:hypothetical protein